MDVYEQEPVIEHLHRQGERLNRGYARHRHQPWSRQSRDARWLSVQPAVQHARPGWPTVAGVPHAVPPRDDRAGRAHAVTGRELSATRTRTSIARSMPSTGPCRFMPRRWSTVPTATSSAAHPDTCSIVAGSSPGRIGEAHRLCENLALSASTTAGRSVQSYSLQTQWWSSDPGPVGGKLANMSHTAVK